MERDRFEVVILGLVPRIHLAARAKPAGRNGAINVGSSTADGSVLGTSPRMTHLTWCCV
jgi:hypothetical protein